MTEFTICPINSGSSEPISYQPQDRFSPHIVIGDRLILRVYTGLGRNWLQRAQVTLTRIQQEEGNDSSSGGSGQAGTLPSFFSSHTSDQDADQGKGSPPADTRRQGQLYVEARGYLQPAVDFFATAVRTADASGCTTGDLLASVCLAWM